MITDSLWREASFLLRTKNSNPWSRKQHYLYNSTLHWLVLIGIVTNQMAPIYMSNKLPKIIYVYYSRAWIDFRRQNLTSTDVRFYTWIYLLSYCVWLVVHIHCAFDIWWHVLSASRFLSAAVNSKWSTEAMQHLTVLTVILSFNTKMRSYSLNK